MPQGLTPLMGIQTTRSPRAACSCPHTSPQNSPALPIMNMNRLPPCRYLTCNAAGTNGPAAPSTLDLMSCSSAHNACICGPPDFSEKRVLSSECTSACRCEQELVAFAKKNGSIIVYDAAYALYISDRNCPKSIFEIEGAQTACLRHLQRHTTALSTLLAATCNRQRGCPSECRRSLSSLPFC